MGSRLLSLDGSGINMESSTLGGGAGSSSGREDIRGGGFLVGPFPGPASFTRVLPGGTASGEESCQQQADAALLGHLPGE